jgi:hypothetical protein
MASGEEVVGQLQQIPGNCGSTLSGAAPYRTSPVMFGGQKFGNATLADLTRWPPQTHRSPPLRIDPKIPPQAWTLTR